MSATESDIEMVEVEAELLNRAVDWLASTRDLIEDAMSSILHETDNEHSPAWTLLVGALEHLEGVEVCIP